MSKTGQLAIRPHYQMMDKLLLSPAMLLVAVTPRAIILWAFHDYEYKGTATVHLADCLKVSNKIVLLQTMCGGGYLVFEWCPLHTKTCCSVTLFLYLFWSIQRDTWSHVSKRAFISTVKTHTRFQLSNWPKLHMMCNFPRNGWLFVITWIGGY